MNIAALLPLNTYRVRELLAVFNPFEASTKKKKQIGMACDLSTHSAFVANSGDAMQCPNVDPA